MTRLPSLLLLLAPLCACLEPVQIEPTGSTGPTGQPDVLLISLDTLRADRLSCYGYARQTSPSIDLLAAGGMRFATAIAPSIHTAPSHMSIFTGLDPVSHGVENLSGNISRIKGLNEDLETLPERLQARGYQTSAFTDHGNLHPKMGFKRGWDQSHFKLEPMPDKVDAVEEWLARAKPSEPSFVFFHTYQVHSPYAPPLELHGTFADTAYDGILKARYQSVAALRAGGSKRLGALDFLEGAANFTDADNQFLSALYDECILAADMQVARLLDLWKQQRPGREFVVILVSDHGEGLGELGQYGHHEGSSKELVHVPLIFNGPGIPSGVQDQPVSLTGLAGTLFEYLDIAPFKLHSRSFLDLVQDEQSDFDPGPAYMQLWTPRRQETYDAIHVGASHLSRTKRDGQTEARLMEWEEGQSRPLEGAQLAEELEQLLEQRYLADRTFRAVHPPRMDQDANNDEMDLIRNLGYMGDE